MTMIKIEDALDELQEKTMIEIERETAQTWGGRAAASFQLSERSDEPQETIRRFYEGENFRQEALEHAAMVEDHGDLVATIQDEVDRYRAMALEHLKKVVLTH